MKVKPLFDRVIAVKVKESKNLGGIILPTSVAEQPVIAKVIAVGRGELLDSGEFGPMEIKVGDKILFHEFSAVEFKTDDENVMIVKQTDVLGIVCNSDK